MMTNRTLKALMQYSERNLFLRAIVRQLGFREGFVYYDRKAREAGESKYPITKMLSFSIDGITSFSVAPLRFITFLGLSMTLVAFIMIIFALVEHIQTLISKFFCFCFNFLFNTFKFICIYSVSVA